ncbi:sensor histidine kinase [Roseomonas sp. KE2513]|uniref:sensor histidine kinase n=1 Tax=Roseomonas sp. KE2513 TaxID=2479202 RepID=UPI0018DF8EEB|nr:PAS domain S-box protein [Roseomonas sp. KE2513]
MSRELSLPAGPGSASQSELFECLIENSTDLAVYGIDPGGIARSWNIGAERVFGYGAEEILGQSADMIFTEEDQAAGYPSREREVALREGRAADERWHRRKDGSRFWASGSLVPRRNPRDGFVRIVRDRSEAHRASEDLRKREGRFHLLAASIPQLVFRTLPSGSRSWGSPQWTDFAGMTPEESVGFGWMQAIHPEDLPATREAWEGAEARGEYDVEHRVRRAADGEYRWHRTRARPVATPGGSGGISPSDGAAGSGDWVGTMTDIHDLRGLKDRQAVLLAELQHRTRNLLAVVQAIASQTMRKSRSLEDFGGEFEGRLHALSRVQSLLARSDHQDIDLHSLLEMELTAHGDGTVNSGRITVGGPPVSLPALSAQAMGLAVHELATNAVKHGALSRPDARLSVTWETGGGNGTGQVVLEWRERGVPMPEDGAPRRQGYGTELIRYALPYQLRAKTSLDFGHDGVRCTIAVPVRPAGAGTDHG